MFRNYLTVAVRNLLRHKAYSFINILGLGIGVACCALIMLYVQYELNYDGFHSKGDRIYRVLRETRGVDGSVIFRPGISGPFAPALMKDFPELEMQCVSVSQHVLRPGLATRENDPFRSKVSGCWLNQTFSKCLIFTL